MQHTRTLSSSLPRHHECRSLLVRLISPADAGPLHALMESHGHLGCFTVLNPASGLLRLLYPAEQQKELDRFLETAALDIPMQISPWPFPD